MYKFSLQHLFVGTTFCALATAIVLADLHTSVLLLISIACIATSVFLFATMRSVVVACALSWPLLWILNFSSIIIALGFMFGTSGFAEITFGYIACALAYPIIIVQNSFPWGPVWLDSMVGVFAVSLIEVIVIAKVTTWIRNRNQSKRDSKTTEHKQDEVSNQGDVERQ